MEPETDDNLITWGFTDHLLQVGTGASSQAGPPGDEGDQGEGTQAGQGGQQRQGQRVPMMRLVRWQPMPLVEVVPFNRYNRNRYYQLW